VSVNWRRCPKWQRAKHWWFPPKSRGASSSRRGRTDGSDIRFGRYRGEQCRLDLLSRTQDQRPVHKITEEEWDVIMRTNLKGPFCCRDSHFRICSRTVGETSSTSPPDWAERR
jgi:hypothetical protein